MHYVSDFLRQLDLPSGTFLLIDDETPDIGDWRRPKVFDSLKHSFNPLNRIDYKKARELTEILYAFSPQGENTLTVRNGRRGASQGASGSQEPRQG
jgi:hypothetical protein